VRAMTLLPDDDRRRSLRVATHCPLTLRWRDAKHRGSAAIINEQGALLLSPFTCPKGSLVEIENEETGRSAFARVVWGWFGDSRPASRFRLGVEFVEQTQGFWGEEYERIARREPPATRAARTLAARSAE